MSWGTETPESASLGVQGPERSLSRCCHPAPRLCCLVGGASGEAMQGAVWVLACGLRVLQPCSSLVCLRSSMVHWGNGEVGDTHGQSQLGSAVSFRPSCWTRALGKAEMLPRGTFVPPPEGHYPKAEQSSAPHTPGEHPQSCTTPDVRAVLQNTGQPPAPPWASPSITIALTPIPTPLGSPTGAGFGQGVQQRTARRCISVPRHGAAIPPNTPIPPSSAPGELWFSPRVFPQPGPSSQARGSSYCRPWGSAFPLTAEAGEHAQPKGPRIPALWAGGLFITLATLQTDVSFYFELVLNRSLVSSVSHGLNRGGKRGG